MIANVSKTNGVKLFALFAMLAMVIAGAAVVLSDNGVDAADDTQYYSGVIGKDVHQEFPAGTNVIIDKKLTITEKGSLKVIDGNLTVNEGVEVIIQKGGSLIVNGLVTINGDVKVTDETSSFKVAPVSPDDEKYKDAGVIINGTVTITGKAIMDVDGESSDAGEGDSGGDEEAVGNVLVNNNGQLNVSSSGSKISQINNINVDVAVGGTFHFDGITKSGMTVSSYGSGDNQTYAVATIGMTGNKAANNTTADLTFTATGSNYTAYGHADKTTSVKNMTTFLVREYALNISGTVDGATSLAIDGKVKFAEEYDDDKYYTSEAAAKQNIGVGASSQGYLYNDFVQGKILISDLNVKNGSTLTINEDAYVTVTGTVDVSATTSGTGADADITSETFMIDGTIEVVGNIKANYASLGSTGTSDSNKTGTIAINGGKVTMTNSGAEDVSFFISVYGAMWADDDDDATSYIESLSAALANADAADIENVMVCGLAMSWGNGSDIFNGRGAYLVDSDLTIPSGMTLTINCGLRIAEGATLTVPADAALDFALNKDQVSYPNQWSGIWVEGKLVDYDTLYEDDLGQINFEVMSQVTTESEVINTYTTFAIALSETTSGTIYLYDDVIIDRNMTIPADVTVQYANETKGDLSFEADAKYTLTIDGELYLSAGHTIYTTNGTVVVNNVLRTFNDEDTAGTSTIKGAHFNAALEEDDDTNYYYVTSVAFAATNSANIDNATPENNVITILGNIAMGDVTFTLGEDVQSLTVSISNTGNDKATGNVTLVGASFNTENGIFDGTVTSAVTAGTTTVDLDNVKGVTIDINSVETTEGTTTEMGIASENGVSGTLTVVAGAVTVSENIIIQKLVIASGATVNADADITTTYNPDYKFNTTSTDLPVFTEAFIANVAGLIVNGDLVIDEGANINAQCASIGGNVTVTEGSFYVYLSYINGNVTIADGAAAQLAIGLVNGAITGDIILESAIAFPGSDLSGAEIYADNLKAEAQTTTVYINGAEYGTVYAKDGVTIESILLFTDVDGVKIDSAKLYSDASMNNLIVDLTTTNNETMVAIKGVATAVKNATGDLSGIKAAILSAVEAGTVDVGDYSEIYIGMDPATVTGTVSVGTGLDMYIDNVKVYGQSDFELDVGTHTVSFDVKAGYDGSNATITFNGQTVTNGTITVTDGGFTLMASGAVPQNYSGGSSGSSDDGMGLTDYLLIILVVLIVIMAIMVAMRLMRS